MEIYDNILWALDCVYEAMSNVAKERLYDTLNALTVVANVDHENFMYERIYGGSDCSKATFTLSHEDYAPVDCVVILYRVNGPCHVRSYEILNNKGDVL